MSFLPCGNLYARLPPPGGEEWFDTLFHAPGLRIERIVSDGQVSPPGFWYEQDEDEWVVLLQGEASLEYADGSRQLLCPGDWVALPARTRHRVAHTGPHTVWLAVFAAPSPAPAGRP